MIKKFINYFKSHNNFRKIFFNSGWLMLEKIVRLFSAIIIGILVARHLGPENFGILSYALSIISFLGTFTYLGLSGLIIKEIVNKPDEKNIILGTTFYLKLFGGIIALIIVIIISYFIHIPFETEFWVLIIIGFSLLARPFETIEHWFYSITKAKHLVIAKSIAFITTSLLNVIFVLLGMSVIFFAIAASLEFFLIALFLVVAYHIKNNNLLNWRFNFTKAKILISQSWIIILSGFLALINLKVDQVMLRWLINSHEVGIYAVAVRISEVWYFIPTAIAVSAFPRLLELRKQNNQIYTEKLQNIFDILFIISLFIAIFTSIFAKPIIPFLFGMEYNLSANILIIHIWAGIFMFMRALFSKWVFIEDALLFSLISHGSGAIINIILNLLLIPYYHGIGAAIATLFSYAVSSYFFLFFHKKTRSVASMMNNSFLLPIRLLKYLLKG